MSPNFNSMFYDSVVSSPTEPQLTSPDGSIDPKGGLSYISVYSTVMVFNPDFNPDFNPNFNFGNIIKRSSTGPINGNFTSWFESDGESSPARNTPLAKIEEITLSPKSNPKSIITCDLEGSPAYPNKVYSESNGSRIGISPTWLKPNRKVNPKKQSPPQIGATVPANGESSQRLDRRCMLERSDAQYNSILLSESQDEDQTGSCRSREASDGGLGDRGTGYQKLILDSSSTVYSASNNSSSSTIRPIEAPATVAAVPIAEEPSNKNLRIFRPKLQLRTAISNSTFRSTPILIAPPASRERRNSKEKGLTQSKGPRATSSHSAVSRASSPERDTTETPQESRTKLPLSALLLSPLGAVARNRSKSTSRGRFSIALSLSNGNNNNNTTTTTKSNSTARPSSASGGPSQEIDEADEEVAELSDIVSHRQVVGSAKEQQPSGSSRSVSRFRRFSLAYLSGSEHDYDGGSEQSSRSPLRSWKSWSNRSSIASFSSVSNKHSRRRYSAASIFTSQGSSLSTSALDHHTHPETGIHVDDRRRPSLSSSSVAELPWRQVPPQTYAHQMSSGRNSVATPTVTHHWQTLTQTFTATKAPSLNLTAATSRSSDGSSIHSLVERVYSAQPTPSVEKEDPFVTFYMATKPKTSALEIQAEGIRAYEKQEKQEKLLQRIANGSFFDSDDEEDEGAGMLDENEDLFGRSAAHDWWMSGIEESPEGDEDWKIPRVPSLEFDTRSQQRESSISTGTTLTTDDLHPSTPTAAEIARYRKITELAMTEPLEKRRRRRRTASSECLIVDAAECLRTMYLEKPSDDCAVEVDDDIVGKRYNSENFL